jgi:hypothetical protein
MGTQGNIKERLKRRRKKKKKKKKFELGNKFVQKLRFKIVG